MSARGYDMDLVDIILASGDKPFIVFSEDDWLNIVLRDVRFYTRSWLWQTRDSMFGYCLGTAVVCFFKDEGVYDWYN